jgi:DNA (cytosine-5)-methyltransferase 1
MRYLSVCSGMEAASVAWHPLGFKPIGFSEIEPFPCAILSTRYPQIPNYGSLTEYKQWPLEPGAIDLLVGGTPCQSFSVAGLRKGLDDPRGNLALVFLGLADKLKPRWIVWENVPGVLSSNGGRDLGSFLGALGQLGYGWAMRVLDAQHFGVPQRRRRVFVVACLGDWRAPAEVLLEPDCVRRDPKKGRAKGQGPAAGAEGGAGADHPEGCWWDGGQVSQTLDAVLQKGQTMPEKNRFPAVLQPLSHWDGSDVHPTLNQSAKGSGGVGASNQELFSQGGAYLVPGQPIQMPHIATAMAVRRLTPVECERLQGFPDNWSRISWKGKPEDQCPDGPRYKACGNSMAVPVMRWIGERIAAADAKHFPNA